MGGCSQALSYSGGNEQSFFLAILVLEIVCLQHLVKIEDGKAQL